MLLTREEKQTLKDYLSNLQGFALEASLTEEQSEKIQAEVLQVQDKIDNSKKYAEYEVIDTNGDPVERFSSIFHIEQKTGVKRNYVMSRINQIQNRGGRYLGIKGNELFDGTVFSVKNQKTNERVYIRILDI